MAFIQSASGKAFGAETLAVGPRSLWSRLGLASRAAAWLKLLLTKERLDVPVSLDDPENDYVLILDAVDDETYAHWETSEPRP